MRIVVLAFLPVPALAGTFAPIATLSGTPQIGGVVGTTLYGVDPAANGNGVLFSLATDGTGYAVLHSFDGANDGSLPNGQLAVSASGIVYGTAEDDGAAAGGTLWQYAAGTGFAVLHAFGANGDGKRPLQGPTLAATGTLTGSTAAGAINTNGNAWALASSGTYTALHSFLSQSDGHCPFSGVADTSHGQIYGTTVGHGYGGNPNGSVWRITPTGNFRTLYVFANGPDGEWPDQAPTLDRKGNLVGTTRVQNGREWAGAIWKITPGGAFSVIYNLNGTTDGSGPNAPLLLGRDGNFYGTTASGGSGNGTLFRVSRAGAFTVLHTFSGGADGAAPTGALAEDGAGAIYGGSVNGVVWRYMP